MDKTFFDQPRREWSARKHAILKKYLPAFCTALSRISRQHYAGVIWYVDGFAGAGRHEEDGSPGSPLLALEAIRDLTYDIRCLNVEEDKACFANLERETAAQPKVSNIYGDCTEVIDRVLHEVRDDPALFFLDPFGMKDLPIDGLIDKIARRRRPTDILLRYDSLAISRIIGAALNVGDLRSAANARNLDHIFQGTGWRDVVAAFPSGKVRDDALLTHYLEQITSMPEGRFRFAASYPIRTIEGNLKYHMVFATGDRLGIKIMSEVLRQAEASYQSDQEDHRQQKIAAKPVLQHDMFADESENNPEHDHQTHIMMVQKTLREVGQKKKRDWEFEELFYELLLHQNWFARLSEKDYREACKGLKNSGGIERISEGRAWNKGTQFRIVE